MCATSRTMPKPPSPETLAAREQGQYLRVTATQLYLEFLRTNPGQPRNPMTLTDMLDGAETVRKYIVGEK